MSKILQFENGVHIYKRYGKRVFSGTGLPPALQPGAGKIPVYLTSIDVSDYDITGKVVCLNDKRVLYEFGKGFGQIAISGEILIGTPAESTHTHGKLKPIIKFFNSKRVSAPGGKAPLTISAGKLGGKFKFYLTTFSFGQIRPEIGLINFQLSGDLIDMTL
mgnify:CR=1 FL=1